MNSYKIGPNQDIILVHVLVKNHIAEIIAVHIVNNIAGIYDN